MKAWAGNESRNGTNDASCCQNVCACSGLWKCRHGVETAVPNRRVPLQCPTAKYPCSAQLLLAKLVGALESALRCTSSAVGSCARSGTLRSVLALQTALSRARRGSLPSAMTMLSLPIAAPSGQCACAALASPANGLIHPACVLVGPGLAGRLDRALLASSWQCRRCTPSSSLSSRGLLARLAAAGLAIGHQGFGAWVQMLGEAGGERAGHL